MTDDPDRLHAANRYDWERIMRRCVIPANTKLVAFVLATYADRDGSRIRPGTARLAAVTGMGESTVRRHVGVLLGLGLLMRQANGGGPHKLAARYQLAFPEDLMERVELLPPSEETPLTQVSGDTGGNSAHSDERSSEDNSAHSDERRSGTDDTELRSFSRELRSFRGVTPLTQVSAHQKTKPQTNPPSPLVSTSPARRRETPKNHDPRPARCPHRFRVTDTDTTCPICQANTPPVTPQEATP